MTPASDTRTNRDLLLRLFEILNTGDAAALDEVMAPDVVTEWPQTGEQVRGIENHRAIVGSYPGGHVAVSEANRTFIEGDAGRYVLTPMFTAVRVVGSGENLVATVKSRYPDGSDWYVIGIGTFRAGKIVKVVQYFAPVSAAPPWRAAWVEPLESEA